MGGNAREELRGTALHLDRYRSVIEAEVDRRLGREEPTPYARAEIVRRFRSFCRLASIDPGAARPSLDGLGGNDPAGLEKAVALAVEVAIQCCPPDGVTEQLRDMELRFRAGLRRIMTPKEANRPASGKKKRRRTPNAGKRVRSAIDRIGDAYFALCLDTSKIYDMNPAAETLLGVEPEKLLNQQLEAVIHPDDLTTYRSLEARLDSGEESGVIALRFNRGDGSAVIAEVTVANHTIAGKRLAIFVARERVPAVEKPVGYSTRTSAPSGIFATSESTARSR